MELVQANQIFSFNYTDPNQRSGLFVRFEIYDVTTSPTLVGTVNGIYTNFGGYVGTFTPAQNKTYMIIGLVFTDGTYVTVDQSCAQYSDIFQVVPNSGVVTSFGFCYSSFDYRSNLEMQATVYKLNTGSPVLMGTAAMAFVAYGTYFGMFSGTAASTYDVWEVVYTDGTFATPDLNYAPGSDQFDALNMGGGTPSTGSNILLGRVADNNLLLGIVED